MIYGFLHVMISKYMRSNQFLDTFYNRIAYNLPILNYAQIIKVALLYVMTSGVLEGIQIKPNYYLVN